MEDWCSPLGLHPHFPRGVLFSPYLLSGQQNNLHCLHFPHLFQEAPPGLPPFAPSQG